MPVSPSLARLIEKLVPAEMCHCNKHASILKYMAAGLVAMEEMIIELERYQSVF